MRVPKLHFLAVLAVIWSSASAADLRLKIGLPGRSARASSVAPLAPVVASHPLHFDIVSSSPFHPAILRRHYEQAASDKAAGEKFYKLLADYKDRDGLVLAYKGAAEAIRARDASMFNKLTYVQDAARTFEQAVSIDPRNPEIRFLRFSVESNLPAFLGLSKHVDEDKELLLNAALAHPNSGLDAEAFRTVRGFLVGRGHVSGAEAERLNRVAE
jgi:hypothetical protein